MSRHSYAHAASWYPHVLQEVDNVEVFGSGNPTASTGAHLYSSVISSDKHFDFKPEAHIGTTTVFCNDRSGFCVQLPDPIITPNPFPLATATPGPLTVGGDITFAAPTTAPTPYDVQTQPVYQQEMIYRYEDRTPLDYSFFWIGFLTVLYVYLVVCVKRRTPTRYRVRGGIQSKMRVNWKQQER